LKFGSFGFGAFLVEKEDLVFVGKTLVECYTGFVDFDLVLCLLVGEPFVALLAVVHEHVPDGEGCGDSTDDCRINVSILFCRFYVLCSCLSPLGIWRRSNQDGV
jgi:hypothetical protein